jgi:hypothetical protein
MKTRAGALKLKKMPWEYDSLALKYYTAGLFSTVLGFFIKFK